MRIARRSLLAVSIAAWGIIAGAAADLSAQAAIASTPRAYVDLSWIGPVVASAQTRAVEGIAQARVALAHAQALSIAGVVQARAGLERARAVSIEGVVQARTGMAVARAALARPWGWEWNGVRASTLGELTDKLGGTPPEPWAQQDPADGLYRDARAALNREQFARAADLFGQVYTRYPMSVYAGDSYYWQAYAYSRRGSDESLHKALDILKLQRQKAPGARTRDDAKELQTRICGQLARGGDEACAAEITITAGRASTPSVSVSIPGGPVIAVAPTPQAPQGPASPKRRGRDECGDDDEIQMAALNALMQMDTDKALPVLKRVLARRDDASLCLRRKAVFIVSQQEGAETEDILLSSARNDPDSEVREQAVWWLSQVDSPKATAALDSILRSATDPVLQDKAIFALSQQDSPKARQALKDFALRGSVSDELREKAIFWIGQGDDPDRLGFLKTLFAQLKSDALREKILFSISQIEGKESSAWLLQVASDPNQDIELRKKALFWVGQSDYPMTELATLYDRMPNKEMKEQLIFVYSQRSERTAVDRLIQIARTETDLELRKKAVFWLGQSDDPRAITFLASLLEKP